LKSTIAALAKSLKVYPTFLDTQRRNRYLPRRRRQPKRKVCFFRYKSSDSNAGVHTTMA
jgi:hypothetical protein